MAYGLRKINKDGKHYNFQWPMEVGDVATCPDWEPTEKCGNGLHFIIPNEGNMSVLDGHYWAVVEYDPAHAVSIHCGDKHKAETLKIVHITEDKAELLQYFADVKFNNTWAYWWAKHIGDKDEMRHLITEPQWAYYWACHIGDKDEMRQLITDPKWAFYWAKLIGDVELMRPLVAGTAWAALWEMYPPSTSQFCA